MSRTAEYRFALRDPERALGEDEPPAIFSSLASGEISGRGGSSYDTGLSGLGLRQPPVRTVPARPSHRAIFLS